MFMNIFTKTRTKMKSIFHNVTWDMPQSSDSFSYIHSKYPVVFLAILKSPSILLAIGHVNF